MYLLIYRMWEYMWMCISTWNTELQQDILFQIRLKISFFLFLTFTYLLLFFFYFFYHSLFLSIPPCFFFYFQTYRNAYGLREAAKKCSQIHSPKSIFQGPDKWILILVNDTSREIYITPSQQLRFFYSTASTAFKSAYIFRRSLICKPTVPVPLAHCRHPFATTSLFPLKTFWRNTFFTLTSSVF